MSILMIKKKVKVDLKLYLKNNLNFVNAYLFFSYIRILNQKNEI